MSTNGRLRELIRAVRSCKTAAEERALVRKECASIRQGFKENRESTRSSNMLKLLYITMLGYPTEFGQVEVVKLLAQGDYCGKRIGYLTLAVVLDETHEVLTLAENHIKKDLSNQNSFVQALALDVVANIAGEDMARDVLHEVEQLVDSPNLYLKKKACLAALRIVKKAPDHAEIFLEKMQVAFHERNQGALMCSLSLINQCLQTEQGQQYLTKYRQLVTSAVRVLKQLVLSSKICDQDIGGVSDPFLQIKLLQFLRITGAGSAAASEAMNDVLAQVATNTDSSKNVGSAVHYECVKTINSIVADDGLRVLGINTVGRFLTSTRDNNVRFVALTTLLPLVQTDVAAVQRHHPTIIDCLKDPDLSIRRRALELTVALIDQSSVRILVPDLIQYLQACSTDVHAEVAEQIAGVIEAKSPTPEWRVELSLRLFKVARQHVPVSFALNFLAFVTQQGTDLQRTTVNGLWEETSGPLDGDLQACHALLLASVWTLGEYGEFVVASGVSTDDVGTCVSTITMNSSIPSVKQYGLTALMKLSTKYPVIKPIAIAVFDTYATNLDCELQQRACEFTTLLESFGEVAKFSFSAMPPIMPSDEEIAPMPLASDSTTATTTSSTASPATATAAAPRVAIDDLFGPAPTAVTHPTPTTVAAPSSVPAANASPKVLTHDDLFAPAAPVAVVTATPTPPVVATTRTPVAPSVHDLFGPTVSTPQAPPASQAPVVDKITSFVAFRSDDCVVNGTAKFNAPATLAVELTLAANRLRLQQVVFHVAVPKTSTIEVHPLIANDVKPGSSTVQKLTVVSSDVQKARQLLLKIKLVYAVQGQLMEHLFTVNQEVQ